MAPTRRNRVSATASPTNLRSTTKVLKSANPPKRNSIAISNPKKLAIQSPLRSMPSTVKAHSSLPQRGSLQRRSSLSARPSNTRRASRSPSLTSTTTTKPTPLERNVDNVVLGDVLFRAWYPSRHVKEIVGREVVDGKEMLERLYVCKWCFKYSKELMAWRGHTVVCPRRTGRESKVPGRRIYVHGDGSGCEGMNGEEVWSVWEVDGEIDTLYCQNLSLFAKLFLDNKSVFFDVTGFLYFLLVHTDCATGEQQVIGFFSKEKMSWDNNNLACILVFPPWQRKGLGSLLVAVSYEISRREQVMGGPEKPISDLGKMGYIRYWSGEVARYLLSVKETDRKKGRGMVTLEDISQGTWVCVDDCLAALRAMDVAVAAGKGKGETPRVRIDKEVVKQWAERTRTPLVPIIDPKGFLEGYGFKETVDEEMGE